MGVGYCKCCGPLSEFTGQENVCEGCVCLMSEVGVAALCGCVSCGLWLTLMWSVCGRELPWAPCRCLLGSEGVCVSNKRSGVAALCGCVSCGLWIPLMWSVCGRGLL